MDEKALYVKIKTLKILEYLYYLIPNIRWTYNTQNLLFAKTYFSENDGFNIFFSIPFLNGTNFIKTWSRLYQT